nr:FAD-dependent monooxygenase [Oceanococcus sp. HetDA_MAG_MS8]
MQTDIVVAGSGCVGSLAAALLAQSGWRVVLVAPGQPLPESLPAEPEARVIALAPQIEQALRACDVPTQPWQERGAPVRAMQVEVPGVGAVEFSAADVQAPALARIVEVSALQRAFEGMLQRQRVRWENDHVVRRSPQGVELASGVHIQAPLVLACDGASSALRTQAHIPTQRHDYRQTAIVARLRASHAAQAVARQTMSAQGVLGVLPLVDGSLSVVWSLPAAVAQRWLQASPAEFAQGLGQALNIDWGEWELLGKRAHFPLRSLHAESLCAEGLALLGDAAHTVHPLAGLGLNLGLADVLSLVPLLQQGREQGRSLADPALLRRWSRQRKAQVAPYRHFIDLLAGLGSKHTLAWRGVGLGFGVVSRQNALRQWFARQALAGSMPAESTARPAGAIMRAQ